MESISSASRGAYTSFRPEEGPGRLEPHRLNQGFDNRGQQGADIGRSVKLLGQMVECAEVSNFPISWISKASFLTSLHLLVAQ